jgi:hypothetical protein
MTMTNFPNGLTSFGIPVLGGAGLPFTGNYYFVDAVNGADGNDGSASSPKQNLTTALSLCVSGNNDVIFLIGDGGTAATQRLTETLAWNKNATHLIGITAPTRVAQRARISHAATAPTTAFTPMVLVTGSGCLFANFSLFEGFNEATAVVTWEDQGSRNYYQNVAFQGMGADAKSADAAGSADLLLTGGGEHTFVNCTIGLDTIARGAANANVRIRSASARNTFDNCLLLCSADAATPIFVDTDAANSLNRWVMFKECDFLNALNISSGATALTAAIAYDAAQNGTVFVNKCSKCNTTDWTAADTATVQLANMPATSGDTGGEYVSSDAT